MPTRTGYSFAGYYDTGATTGGTQYYTSAGASATTWDKTGTQTLYARWTEIKAGATVKAYTNGSASSTGGTVKVGTSGTAGATATTSDSFGIDTASPAIIKASTTAGYIFEGWETGGTYGSHVLLYTDAACTTPYVKATHGGTYTTVYAKTDGYTDNTMTTTNTEIHALFNPIQYTVSGTVKYTDDGTTWNTTTTGGSLTISGISGTTGSYGTTITFTATAESGYAVVGIYRVDGGTETRVETAETYVSGNYYRTSETNNTYVLNDTERTTYTFVAKFAKIRYVSAYKSYRLVTAGSGAQSVVYDAAPPSIITVEHDDGTTDTYTYAASTSAVSTVTRASGFAKDGTGTFASLKDPTNGQTATYGNSSDTGIPVLAGDEVTMKFNALTASDTFAAIFYDNTNPYYDPPAVSAYSSRDYTYTGDDVGAIYVNSNYVTDQALSDPSAYPARDGVDQVKHSVTFTVGSINLQKVSIELAVKPQIIFTESSKLNLTDYNLSGYYAAGESVNISIAPKTGNFTNVLGATAEFKDADGNTIASPGLTYTKNASTGEATLTGTMPAEVVYVTLGVTTTYTLGAGSKCLSDLYYQVSARPNLTQEWSGQVVAGSGTNTDFAVGEIKITNTSTTDSVLTVGTSDQSDTTAKTTSVTAGTQLTYEFKYNKVTVSGTEYDLSRFYSFVGWFYGDANGPDLSKDPITTNTVMTQKYSEHTYVYAVANRAFYIDGVKEIIGGDTDWPATAIAMDFDADSLEYTWTIDSIETSNTAREFKIFSTQDMSRADYWWDSGTGKTVNDDGCTYAKTDGNKNASIKYTTTNMNNGYGAPIVIHWKPSNAAADRFWVTTTPITDNIYVSDGYAALGQVGTTQTSTVVSAQVSGTWTNADSATAYFTRTSGWTPSNEGRVHNFKVLKESTTIKLSKVVGSGWKVKAYVIYNITDDTVTPLTDLTHTAVTSAYKSTGTNGAYVAMSSITGTEFSATYTLAPNKSYYIVPIIESVFGDETDLGGTSSSPQKVTIQFDGSQLNTNEWGDLVGVYAWYGNGNTGAYPGQVMIPDSTGAKGTWKANIPAQLNGTDLVGILFTNYKNDSAVTWLDQNGVLGTIIPTYNTVGSGDYTQVNCKVQTYDYREPIAMYNNRDTSATTVLSFALKSGNSSSGYVISSRHSELTGASTNILTGFTHNNSTNTEHPTFKFDPASDFEYLTDSSGEKYTDINGVVMEDKPTATFYVLAKGMVTYDDTNAKLLRVFYSSNNYDSTVSDNITYTNAANMHYAVQWYVYDASGNYITNMLSAGYADRVSGRNSYNLIAKALVDKGYAVDNKAVAICYDNPRSCGTDDTIDGVKVYASGNPNTSFSAYRLGGQWYSTTTNQLATVTVKVGVYSNGNYETSDSNSPAYGSATARYDTTKGNAAYSTYVVLDNVNQAFVTTTIGDAESKPINLTASTTNFKGWYYMDDNDVLQPAPNSPGAENFYPEFSKSVTYYAIYEAAATYSVKYTGRDGKDKYFFMNASTELSTDEMKAGGTLDMSTRTSDISELASAVTSITVYNQNFTYTLSSPNLSTPYTAAYDITQSDSKYTLTIYYPNSSGGVAAAHTPAAYKDVTAQTVVNFDNDLKNAVSAGASSGQRFVGWYDYTGSTQGELLSTNLNFGYAITRNQSIIAVYGNSAYSGTDQWKSYIEDNQITHEMYSSTTGSFYNDSLIHFRYDGADSTTLVPDGYETGVFIAYRLDSTTTTDVTVDENKIKSYIGTMRSKGLTNAKSSGLGLGFVYIPTPSDNGLSELNRVILCLKSDYAAMNGRKYAVYAYIYDGSNYVISSPAQGTYN